MIDDLRHFSAGVDKKRLAISLSATAVVMLFVTGSWQLGHSIAAPQAVLSTAPLPQQPAVAATDYKALYARMKTACMSGTLRLTWIDPHTGKDRAAFCDVHDTPVADWREVK